MASVITVTIGQKSPVSVMLQENEVISAETSPVQFITGAAYVGTYTATPTTETQTFQTSGKKMTENFVVQPIPSNYGLITWDGSKLTVS